MAMAEPEKPTDWKAILDIDFADPEILQMAEEYMRFSNTKFVKGQTPLHLAVHGGDLEQFRKILSSSDGNEWMHRKAKGGWTVLHWAARQDNPEFVRLLLEKKAATNLLNSEHASALHSAARDGTLEIVRILVESAGMCVNSQTKWGWTPLHCAAKSKKTDVLQFLLEKEANVFLQTESGWLAFHLSCQVGSLDCCRALLESTDRKGQSQMLSARTQNKRTSLFCAVEGMKGTQTTVVKWLVEDCHVPVDDLDQNLYTPLHIASKLGFTDTAECLIKHGASVDFKSEDGYTPLHWAARYNRIGIVDLIKQKADLNAQNNVKDTALHIARRHNHDEIFEMIKVAGADMRIRNKDGLKPEDVSSGIPPEILSRGHASIWYFKDALKRGKTTPHRIKLMLLGDARVGKTSLFRYLCGQKFIEDLASTEGIDTNLISTCEVEVGNTVWNKIKSPHSDFDKTIAQATAERILAAENPPLLIEELPSHGTGKEMVAEYSAEGNSHYAKVKPVTMETSVCQSTAVQDSSTKQDHEPSAYLKQDQGYRDAKHHYLPRQRQPSEIQQLSVSPGVHKLQVDGSKRKPKKKARKPRKKPILHQHDFSDIPVKEIQTFLKSKGTSAEEVKFVVWDFAGQRLYEPMHHAFLTRRALYLIVFNLDKLKGGISEADLQRIYFWFASVHTHTSLESGAVRIFFVGTHRDSPNATAEQLEIAIEQLRDCFQRSSNFSIHVECVHPDKLLATIENSSDKYEDTDICDLRDSLRTVALRQSYMQEEIPLTWLQYEDEIFRKFYQHLSQGNPTGSLQQQCLLSIQDMKEIATKFDIQVDVHEEPFKAMLTFFHDVSLILYPAAMPELDLEMKQALKDVVVPNPQFLVNLMTNLVKIPEFHKQSCMYRPDWQRLETHGILTHRLMTHIMHELQQYSCKDIDILSKLLQALGFICRLAVCPSAIDFVPTADCVTKKVESLSLDQKQDNSAVQGDAITAASAGVECQSEVSYLVPGQLPACRAAHEDFGNNWRGEFYFDFHSFLPPWLFQHLTVKLVAHLQQTDDLNMYNLHSKVCVVGKKFGVNFIIRLLRKRLGVRHQLSGDTSTAELMKWLFDLITDISHQKFKNLAFICGSLCPHAKCLKEEIRKQLKTFHIDEQAVLDVFSSAKFVELRRRGLPAVSCLQELRQSADKENISALNVDFIDVMLTIAHSNGHVEKIYSYSKGSSRRAKVSQCLFSDTDETVPTSTNSVSGVNAGRHITSTDAAAVSVLPADATAGPIDVLEDDLLCGKSNDRVKLKLLERLAKQLTSNTSFKLKFFVARLNFEIEDLEEFLKNSSDIHEQCFDALITWQKRTGDQATIGNLREDLRQAVPWFFADHKPVEASTCADQQRTSQDDIQALLPMHVQHDGLKTSVTTHDLEADAIPMDIQPKHSATNSMEERSLARLKTLEYISNSVLRAVQKQGSSRFYPLGIAMKFTPDEIERITHQKCDYADKLLALFTVKAGEVGKQTAEALLMEACKKIEPPLSIDF